MKNLQIPDQDYQQLVTLARQAGFRVSRGRGSQLRLFVMAAANKCVQADDALASCPYRAEMKDPTLGKIKVCEWRRRR
jgi:hypothetical protein